MEALCRAGVVPAGAVRDCREPQRWPWSGFSVSFERCMAGTVTSRVQAEL